MKKHQLQLQKKSRENAFLFLFLLLSCGVFSQQIFNSSVTTSYSRESKVFEKQREINISDTEITITNFIGGTKPLNLVVHKILEKEDEWDGLMKWYYCTSTRKDEINGYTEYIIVMKKKFPTSMKLNQKVDEVTFITNILSLR